MLFGPIPAPEQFRPRLPVRIFNGAGRLLRRCGWQRPLEADPILRMATRRTGHSDFGELDVREPLRRLVESLEQENHLTSLGRVLIRYTLTQLAEARLGVQAALRSYPQILQEQVVRPIFILGLPRTGTTLLHRLLAQDPASRALYLWELNRPTPQPYQDRDQQLRRTRFHVALFTRHLVPQLDGIHKVQAEAPEECTPLLANTFRSPGFGLYGYIRGYTQWLESLGEENTRAVYRAYQRQLQLLQWQCPPRHWVLKCPLHSGALATLLQLFPDACVILNHRELTEVLPSACSNRLVNMRIYADKVDPRRVAAQRGAGLVSRFLQPALRARAARPDRVCDVFYSELVRDPLATVQAIYERFGLPLSAEAQQRMRNWLACNPQGKHGRHHYTLEQFGLDRATVEALFPGYPDCLRMPAAELCGCEPVPSLPEGA